MSWFQCFISFSQFILNSNWYHFNIDIRFQFGWYIHVFFVSCTTDTSQWAIQMSNGHSSVTTKVHIPCPQKNGRCRATIKNDKFKYFKCHKSSRIHDWAHTFLYSYYFHINHYYDRIEMNLPIQIETFNELIGPMNQIRNIIQHATHVLWWVWISIVCKNRNYSISLANNNNNCVGICRLFSNGSQFTSHYTSWLRNVFLSHKTKTKKIHPRMKKNDDILKRWNNYRSKIFFTYGKICPFHMNFIKHMIIFPLLPSSSSLLNECSVFIETGWSFIMFNCR